MGQHAGECCNLSLTSTTHLLTYLVAEVGDPIARPLRPPNAYDDEADMQELKKRV